MPNYLNTLFHNAAKAPSWVMLNPSNGLSYSGGDANNGFVVQTSGVNISSSPPPPGLQSQFQAGHFDGSTSSIKFTFNNVSQSAWTTECWARWATTSSLVLSTCRFNAVPSDVGHAIAMGVGQAPTFGGTNAGFWVGDDASGTFIGVNSPAGYNDANWHHLVGVWSGGGAVSAGQFTLYADGVALSSTSVTFSTDNAPLTGSGVYTLGQEGNASQFFFGDMCAIAVYPSALTADDVSAHFAVGNSLGGIIVPQLSRLRR